MKTPRKSPASNPASDSSLKPDGSQQQAIKLEGSLSGDLSRMNPEESLKQAARKIPVAHQVLPPDETLPEDDPSGQYPSRPQNDPQIPARDSAVSLEQIESEEVDIESIEAGQIDLEEASESIHSRQDVSFKKESIPVFDPSDPQAQKAPIFHQRKAPPAGVEVSHEKTETGPVCGGPLPPGKNAFKNRPHGSKNPDVAGGNGVKDASAPLKSFGKAPISSGKRFVQIVRVLNKYHAFRDLTPVKLRMILEDLGPTFVKLGQIMSSRQDLLPPEYTKELEKLRSNVNPLPYQTVREEIIKAYGKPPEELFARFDPTPLGAASMAQVHGALTKDGQKVVLKVQRPGIYEQMKVDVAMMKKAGKLISLDEQISSIVDVDEIIDEFWTSAKEEMDFRHEAQNARRFAKENEGLAYIRIPKIYDEFTRQNMLVMEDIGGVEIDDYSALSAGGYSREEIAIRLGMNFLSQVIDYGFFHADPHSGNLKIQDGQICWLDFGMMGEITKTEAAAIARALKSVAARDVNGITEAVLTIGIAPDDLDYVGLSNSLESYLNRYVTQSFSDMDLAAMVEEAVEICHQYGIRLPKGIAMLARSMVTIQGTLKDLDPDVQMLNYISREKTSIDQIDWNKEIENFLSQGYADLKALLNLPLKADRALSLLNHGQLRVGLSIADLKTEILPEVNRWIDRIVICVLIAAMIVGSSIVSTTKMKPMFLDIPLLGFVGFFLSFCLSVWLFYKMIFHAKKGNKLF